MDLHAGLIGLVTKIVEFPLRLFDKGRDLVQPAHTSVAVEDANWTLNVNDGVPPVIVHSTR
jgi:hypothetical protein